MPSDFHYDEMKKLVAIFGYYEMKTGKTSEARVKFINKANYQIRLHKSPSDGIMKLYLLKVIKVKLDL